MSEQLLKQILDKLEQMDSKIDHMETKMDKQFEEVKASINSQHIENINSDDLILRFLDEIKESVR